MPSVLTLTAFSLREEGRGGGAHIRERGDLLKISTSRQGLIREGAY